jgi:hypothetical protein
MKHNENNMEKSTRQYCIDELDNLNNDFRSLWKLRHRHNVYYPLSRILIKQRAIKKLLKFHPERACLNCGQILN